MEKRVEGKVLLAHGAGGRLSHELVARLTGVLGDVCQNRMDDSAVLDLPGRLAFTTDSYVVTPLTFPGGDIGRLAVCGTVNDLSMNGAQPLYLSLALIVEEGLALTELDRIVCSMREAAQEAGVKIVTGDTKVVARGAADKLFVNTSGLGLVPPGVDISGANARPGDAVLLNGTVGDHGLTILSQREGLRFSGELRSDCAPLNGLVATLLGACPETHALRDPTRGGLATTLNEIAAQSGVGIAVQEEAIPVRPSVSALCQLLGLDPYYIANEGKLVAFVPGGAADKALQALRSQPYGREAAIIGRVTAAPAGRVTLRTSLGTTRILSVLSGDLLPRIC
jgi:hydrogenase expression/formation protein HypE